MKIFNFILPVFIFLFALVVFSCSNPMPTDKSMEENFRARESDFHKLVSMMRENVSLESVDENGAFRPRDIYVPAQQLDEYRRLLRETGVKNVVSFNGSIIFIFWVDGDGFYDRYIDPGAYQVKEYIYTETMPSSLFDSLDDTEKLNVKQGVTSGFKKIGDNWFLRYSSD